MPRLSNATEYHSLFSFPTDKFHFRAEILNIKCMTLHLILLNSIFRNRASKTDSVFLILNLLILCNMEIITQLSLIVRCHHFHSLCQDRLVEFVSGLKHYSGALLITSTYSDCIFKATHFCLPPKTVSSPFDRILLIPTLFNCTNKISYMTSHWMIYSNPERLDQLLLICLKI